MDYVYKTHASMGDSFDPRIYDGSRDGRILEKWRELAGSPETIAKIPNLIWTDIAANMLVGTKSMDSAFPSAPVYRVRMHRRRIFYHYAWAFPAIACLVIWISFAAVSLTMYLLPTSHPLVKLPALRDLVNRLSVGRALVAAADQVATPKERLSAERWISIAGQKSIDLFPVKSLAEMDAEMIVLA